MAAIDDKFDRIMSELRAEMRSGFAELRAEIGGVRADLAAFHRHVTMIVAGYAIALIGVLGAVLAVLAAG